MIASANRLRSVGWLVLLGLCLALVLVLAFRVNALRSQIHHAEARIVALKQEKMYLETEFETRSNQQQLKAWNDVEFGYAAPSASQYLEGERQLASLSVPAAIDAPAPIRVASVDDSVIASAAFPAMVSPLSGKALSADDGSSGNAPSSADAKPKLQKAVARVDHAEAVEILQDRLGKVVDVRPKGPVRQETASEKEEAKPRKAEKVGADKGGKVPAKGASAKSETAKSKTKTVAVADKSSAKKTKDAAPTRTAKGKEAKAAR
ncbi:MAG: hypothetical protein VW891_15275 [Novosphingobium sp.]